MFFHIDLDAFFASVEQLDNPEYLGRPLIVGAQPGKRGVVATCSYEARRYGIHSAMPINEAYRRCPEAVFVPVRMKRYAELSAQVMAIFGDFTPDVLQVSIDEASLDMHGTERLWGPPLAAAERIKARVRSDTGLGISIGIATNRYIAKLASGMRKPDGLLLVEPGTEAAFMQELPLKDIWGAGEKTRERLMELGIQNVRDLSMHGEELLRSLLGKATGHFLYLASHGQDPGIYQQEPGRRSIGTETTFNHDVADRETIEASLLAISQQLCERLFLENKAANGLQLKLRYQDFTTFTVQNSRQSVFTSSDDVYRHACKIFDQKWDGRPLRLIGLSFFGFDGDAGQADLFSDEAVEKRRRVEQAVFKAASRGLGRLTKARLIDRKEE